MWSDNPAQNLVIAENFRNNGDFKIKPSLDGGFYVAWLDDKNGYSLRIQKLDANGNLMWPLNTPSTQGILVYSRSITTFAYDFGMTVDSNNNVYFGLDSGITIAGYARPGGRAIACKVSPEGEMLFGENGIVLSPETDLVDEVMCTSTTDNGVAYAWSLDSSTAIRTVKIDADGNPLWDTGDLYQSKKITMVLNSVEPSEDGGVISSFTYNIPQQPPQNKPGERTSHDLLARKLNASGAIVFPAGIQFVYEHTSEYYGLNSTERCKCVSDSNGGVVYAFQCQNNPGNETDNWEVHIQHLQSSGEFRYVQNGIPVTSDRENNHTTPVLGYEVSDDLTYVLWQTDSIPLIYGDPVWTSIRAQCIHSSGLKLWNATGVELESPSVDSTYTAAISILPFDQSAIAAWVPNGSGVTLTPIRTAMINSEGEFSWPDNTVDIKSSAPTIGSTDACKNNYGVIAWADSGETIRAQNINTDGTLGNKTN